MLATELFVDESCRDDYLLCAAVVPARDIAAARKFMRDLKPKNRDRLHMKSESRNRTQIITQFVQQHRSARPTSLSARSAGSAAVSATPAPNAYKHWLVSPLTAVLAASLSNLAPKTDKTAQP